MESYNTIFEEILNRTLSGEGDSDKHLMFLFSLVLQNNSKNILEIGVRHGCTSKPLILGASIVGGQVTGVDIAPTDFRCPEDLINFFKFVQNDSLEFLKNEVNKNSYYDLIFLDGWHSYSHVKQELEYIDQLTDKKSIIVLHDLMAFTYPEYHLPLDSPKETEWGEGGPTRAVFELDKDKWEWATIPVNNGLTILRKK